MAAPGVDGWEAMEGAGSGSGCCCGSGGVDLNCTDDIDVPGPGGTTVYCTIQDVGGCPCVDGATVDLPREDPGWSISTDGFREVTGLCPDFDTGLACRLGNIGLICDNGVLILGYQQGFGVCATLAGVSAATDPSIASPGTYTQLDIISFNPSPFELVVEADTAQGFPPPGPCFPARLRFIFTRA